MAQKLAGGNGALALLCNTLPTGAILTSTGKITTSYLTTLDQQRLGLSDIFATGHAAAS